ncbi:MAG: hypothetical protein AABN33_29000 [Acidobacteriota bacterium]
MKVRFFLDEATGLSHIYNHGVNEEEVEDVLTNPGEDRPVREGLSSGDRPNFGWPILASDLRSRP